MTIDRMLHICKSKKKKCFSDQILLILIFNHVFWYHGHDIIYNVKYEIKTTYIRYISSRSGRNVPKFSIYLFYIIVLNI